MRKLSTESNLTNKQAISSVVQLTDQSVYAAPRILSNELAKSLEIKQKSMTQLIRRHKTELGVIEFEKQRNRIIYHLTPTQAYMLLCSTRTNETTYRKRIETMNLIQSEITAIEREQAARQVLRVDSRNDNRDLNNLISQYYSGNNFAYMNFNDLLCRLTTGMNAKTFRQVHGLNKNQPIDDYLTKDEQVIKAKTEKHMMGLIEMHLTYKEIRALFETDKARS